jgi:hypothetical protein
MATIETWESSTIGETVETKGSHDEKFTVNKFQECDDAWRDTTIVQ